MTQRKSKEDYPNTPRDVDYKEVQQYVMELAQYARDFNATQIIGVARSGMPYATWVAQLLNLELGMVNPKSKQLHVYDDKNYYNQRYFIIDETAERGNTAQLVKKLFNERIDRRDLYFINAKYAFATVFVDYFHPNKGEHLYVKELDFWADNIAGVMKNISVQEPHWRDK